MNQTSTSSNPDLDHKKSLANSPLIEIRRSFRAPVEKVWDAWSKVELLKQWWGPEGYSSPSGSIDFRVGGKFLFAMQAPDGKVMWDTGEYLEIIPYERIVCSDQFSDKDGNPISAKEVGMPGDWPDKLYVTIEFEGQNTNQTTMIISHEGIPGEIHDECVEGWSSSVDKLQKLVEKN